MVSLFRTVPRLSIDILGSKVYHEDSSDVRLFKGIEHKGRFGTASEWRPERQRGSDTMTTSTTIRHLKTLVRHLEDNDFSTAPQDKALHQAIATLQTQASQIGRASCRER